MQRQDALQRLATGAAQAPHGAPAPEPTQPSPVATRRNGRRWGMVVGAVVALAVVVGLVARFGPWRLGGAGGTPAAALTARIISVTGKTGLYCPSAPVWSPDSAYIAVVGQTTPAESQSNCPQYNTLTYVWSQSIVATGSANTYAVAEFDAKSGALIQKTTLPDTFKTLCAGSPVCSVDDVAPAAPSWSPDGKDIAVAAIELVTYPGADGATVSQPRAMLSLVPARKGGAIRTLVAAGRAIAESASGNIPLSDLYSPPLFEWDLTSGAGSYTDIPAESGTHTMPFAPSYRMDTSGAVAGLSDAAPHTATPWTYAAINISGTAPVVSLDASQWMWSADGRFVVPNLDVGAYLDVPPLTGTPAPNNLVGFADPTVIAPPTPAIAALVKSAVASHQGAYVALNPSGDRIATFMCEQDSGAGKIAVLAVASGATLKSASYQFPTDTASLGCAGDAEAITWSPDGAHIASADIQDGQIIIWRAPAAA